MEAHVQVQSPAVAPPTPAVSQAATGVQRQVRLLAQVRWQIRQLHYSLRTEDALGRLHGQGHISNPVGSAKSVVLTPLKEQR